MPRPLTETSALWPRLFWGMALFGLLLLPSDYRAGADSAHAHAFAHLWADAVDGMVHHHHAEAYPDQDFATNWFAPEVHEQNSSAMGAAVSAHPDVGEQHDSAPAASGLHLLVNLVTAFAVLAVGRSAPSSLARRPTGRFPRVLHPPPRWMPTIV